MSCGYPGSMLLKCLYLRAFTHELNVLFLKNSYNNLMQAIVDLS